MRMYARMIETPKYNKFGEKRDSVRKPKKSKLITEIQHDLSLLLVVAHEPYKHTAKKFPTSCLLHNTNNCAWVKTKPVQAVLLTTTEAYFHIPGFGFRPANTF